MMWSLKSRPEMTEITFIHIVTMNRNRKSHVIFDLSNGDV